MVFVLVIMLGEKLSDRLGCKKFVWCFIIFLLKYLMCFCFWNKMGEFVVEIVINFIICKY